MSLNDFIKTLCEENRFTERFVKENGLDAAGFTGWAFHNGMLFRSMEKWWGKGERPKPHEGLDLCLFKDRNGGIHHLSEGALIPSMHSGIVVQILDDFLGKTLIIAHNTPSAEGSGFCTIFGHTVPAERLSVGTTVQQGEAIGTIAGSGRSSSGLLPHLHISAGWKSTDFTYEELNWSKISSENVMSLIDPLEIINTGNVTIIDSIDAETIEPPRSPRSGVSEE